MRGTWFVALTVLVVAACTDEMPLTGGAARSVTQVSSPLQGVRADGELVPFPELQEVPEIAVGLMQQEYAERLDDPALVEAVRRTGGRVTIGLKPAGRGNTAETGRIPGMSRSEVLAAREEIRGRAIRLVRTFRTISDVVAEIDPEQAPAIRRLPFVNYLEPDESLHPGAHYMYLAPDDRLQFAAQDTSWGLKKIGAHSVWTTYGHHGEYASITMIDTGVDSTHLNNPGLDGPEMLTNCLYVSPTATSCYQHWNHGAAVAGVMSARDNSTGYIGIAHFPYRFSSINVCSLSACPWGDKTAALDWAVSSGYARHVVNISMQACNGNSTFASSLAQAANAGILVVSIAGNTDFTCSSGSGAGTSGVTYPGKYAQVVAVSGTMEDDSFATGTSPCSAGSRWGPEVVLSAPFWHPSMTTSGGWHPTWCGTSFSAPTVAAAAAVLWSANTSWTAAQVLDRLILTATDLGSSGHDNQFGWGRVALYDAFSTVPPPPPPPPLDVQIQGPTSVKPGATCTWTATANGAPPLSYDWRLNGSPVGWYGATFEHTSGSNNFDLGVVITDSAEGSGSASVRIAVSWEAPDCLDM